MKEIENVKGKIEKVLSSVRVVMHVVPDTSRLENVGDRDGYRDEQT